MVRVKVRFRVGVIVKARTAIFSLWIAQYILVRGGVEDTRLEAKAKDTKKIRGQGQGQPFRGQTLSRPRTGMLEAKAKDQGHKRKCSPKKKKKSSQKFFRRPQKKKKRSSQKFFKRSPQKRVFQKIFQALHKILIIQKLVLSSSRGQANFRGLEASRPRPSTSKCVLEDVLEAKDVLEDSTSDISILWSRHSGNDVEECAGVLIATEFHQSRYVFHHQQSAFYLPRRERSR